jgi:hypothetical protein
MFSAKITPALRSRLDAGDPAEMLDVIVEFSPAQSGAASDSGGVNETLGRSEKIAAQKREFTEVATPVEQLVTDLGGEVMGRAWLNGTLEARLRASRVRDLTTAPGVRTLDVPHRLSRD